MDPDQSRNLGAKQRAWTALRVSWLVSLIFIVLEKAEFVDVSKDVILITFVVTPWLLTLWISGADD